MLMPGAFPISFAPGGKVGIYFEAAAVIVVLVLLGQVLELRARSKTGGAIRSLLNLAPKTARLVQDGEERDVPLESVQAGAKSVSYTHLDVYKRQVWCDAPTPRPLSPLKHSWNKM